ncbi:hypothetical protein J0H58_35815 [bacterium]|nr:hypothetical protein [bacterium]
MDGKAKRWLRVLAVVTIFAGAATAVKAVLNHLFDDFKARGERESESLDEARERGILVAEVVADPTEAEFPGGRIRFGRAWVEERSLPTHRFVWFPVERRKGGYPTARGAVAMRYFVEGSFGGRLTATYEVHAATPEAARRAAEAAGIRVAAVAPATDPAALGWSPIPHHPPRRVSGLPNPPLVVLGLATAALPTACLGLMANPFFLAPFAVGVGCVLAGCLPIPRVRRWTAAAVGAVVCGAAVGVPLVLATPADREGRPVRIVLPVGYRGGFSVVKDGRTGKRVEVRDGEWVYEIPADGMLVVADDGPLYLWHRERYVYADGKPARAESVGTTGGRAETPLGPGSYTSGRLNGTTHTWRVVDAP